MEAKDSKTFSHEIVTLEKKKKKSKKKKDVESGTFTICKAIVANQGQLLDIIVWKKP